MLKHIKLYGTTTAGGALTVTANTTAYGMLKAVEWIDGDLVDGVDAVLTLVRNDNAADITLLTLTDANTDAVYYTRVAATDNAGAAIEYAATFPIYVEPFLNGTLSLTIASGGATKSGGLIVYYEA